jgi:hypothetical protein
MDSLITVAGRALAAGDALTALKRVALREDPPALALRGIAMAQLGELARAQDLLKRAARGFGPREPLAQARWHCVTSPKGPPPRRRWRRRRRCSPSAVTLRMRPMPV